MSTSSWICSWKYTVDEYVHENINEHVHGQVHELEHVLVHEHGYGSGHEHEHEHEDEHGHKQEIENQSLLNLAFDHINYFIASTLIKLIALLLQSRGFDLSDHFVDLEFCSLVEKLLIYHLKSQRFFQIGCLKNTFNRKQMIASL
jgi:hypothetical protein